MTVLDELRAQVALAPPCGHRCTVTEFLKGQSPDNALSFLRIVRDRVYAEGATAVDVLGVFKRRGFVGSVSTIRNHRQALCRSCRLLEEELTVRVSKKGARSQRTGAKT